MFTKLKMSKDSTLLDLTGIGLGGEDLNNDTAVGQANGFLEISWT